MSEPKNIDEAQNGVHIVSLTDYVRPDLIEDKSKKFVLLGENNEYFDHLIDLYLYSTTNNSCINGVAQLAYGGGCTSEEKEVEKEQWAKFKSLFTEDVVEKSILELKRTGRFVLQIDYAKSEVDESEGDLKKKPIGVYYLDPKNIGIGLKDEEGEIDHYYYCEDWEKRHRPKYRPEPVPAFGMGGPDDESEILYVQLPLAGEKYYSPVDYQGGLQYAECELELANYHVTHILNGFAPAAIVNFNNGDPGPVERKRIVRDIQSRHTGSENASKLVVLFNDSPEAKATIEQYDITDPHSQYEFISNESKEKILLSHRITSPLLLGIRDGNSGLGSNADEIKQAYTLFDSMVLKPLQDKFLKGIEPVLSLLGISISISFRPLTAFENIMNQDSAPVTEQNPNKPNNDGPKPGVNLHSHDDCPAMSEAQEKIWLEYLKDKGEKIDFTEWYPVYMEDITEDDDFDVQLRRNIQLLEPYANPQGDSRQGDTGLFKVRYQYSPMRLQSNSRRFCIQMVQDARQDVFYRREDIDIMSSSGVNSQFAARGESTYSIWLYKGGVNCHHRWKRVIFFRRRDDAGRFLPRSTSRILENDVEKTIAEARKMGIPTDVLNPEGWQTAKTKPINMPRQGRKN